jgi:hypothetical protein
LSWLCIRALEKEFEKSPHVLLIKAWHPPLNLTSEQTRILYCLVNVGVSSRNEF